MWSGCGSLVEIDGEAKFPDLLPSTAGQPGRVFEGSIGEWWTKGYEGLVARCEEALWKPDYGPEEIPPRSGAVAVGARLFLVAFNAYLDTNDVEVARAIAGEVRERDGGRPGLKALGLEVGGRAQVSMNLTDLERTPLSAALEAVRRSAENRGARVESTELVGMVPLSAIIEAARYYLALPDLGPEHVLEAALWEGWRDSPGT